MNYESVTCLSAISERNPERDVLFDRKLNTRFDWIVVIVMQPGFSLNRIVLVQCSRAPREFFKYRT